jgi:very-short-patch-repair endonuclease
MQTYPVAHRSQLLARGMSIRQISAAVDEGRMIRVRKGWYAAADAPGEVIQAVRVGGSLTSLSAARLAKLWTPQDTRLHVAVARNASRLRSPYSATRPLDRERDRVCVHPLEENGIVNETVQPLARAVAHAARCQSEEMALTVIDSALNLGFVTEAELRLQFESLSRRCRRTLDRAERRSQSGTETLVRVRLLKLGIHLTVQAMISGVGHVDLLVGDRFVIECDSHSWHWLEDRYAEDHRRDAVLVSMNYIVFRVTYEMVMFDWPWVESVVRGIVSARKHTWPRRRSEAGGELLGRRG